MSEPLRLRLMTSADFAFAETLRAIAGWNQTAEDWQRFLTHEPEGCFVAEWNGAPAGTATTTSYGTDVAWIGMVLVHPDLRRHGIGKALLNRCIEYLQERRIRSIKLDATPLGKKLYDTLGFHDEWTMTRWETAGLRLSAPAGKNTAGPGLETQLVEGLDAESFGVSRQKMIALTAKQSRGCLHRSAIDIDGYGLLRPGKRANYLGPVVARSSEIALHIVNSLVSQFPGEPIYWDIPDPNTAGATLAKSLGFAPQRQLIRMYLGENHCPGLPLQQFGIGAPEIG